MFCVVLVVRKVQNFLIERVDIQEVVVYGDEEEECFLYVYIFLWFLSVFYIDGCLFWYFVDLELKFGEVFDLFNVISQFKIDLRFKFRFLYFKFLCFFYYSLIIFFVKKIRRMVSEIRNEKDRKREKILRGI